MLLIKAYYYLCLGFIYTLVAICDLLHWVKQPRLGRTINHVLNGSKSLLPPRLRSGLLQHF
jgi:hypothetical protein